MHIKNNTLKLLLIYFLSLTIYSTSVHSDHSELIDLSVEDLLNIEVISVSKKAKSLNDSPAAIYVITQDDINRVGATSIPEALRLAPGLNVARIDSNKWAISSRGFNGRFSNKLLVLIDGRSIYTTSFSGVYWENQDVLLEDIERIEVIRGPGATLWGANAVNGVINIITKHSSDTQGGLLAVGGGTEEQGFGGFRYGGKLNTNSTARAYIKGFTRDSNTHEQGGNAGDDWDKVQGGFRVDSQLTAKDNLTIQGDAYRSIINQKTTLAQLSAPYINQFDESINTFGGNFLIKQQHNFSSTSDYSLQLYYDFYERDEVYLKDTRQVIDIDFHHHFSPFDWNDVIWGVGYRLNHDDLRTSSIITATPNSRIDHLFSTFIQDEITLINNVLWFTLGSKFEHNNYSGFEAQPTARLMWAPHPKHRLWSAASRAVRTPSRLEHTINIVQAVGSHPSLGVPIAFTLTKNAQFSSEEVISYEIGYRTTMFKDLSIDFTSFYNQYSNLRSGEKGTPDTLTMPISQPHIVSNHFSGHSYGFEIAAVWQMLDWWRWDANYSLLKTEYAQSDAVDQLGLTPQQQISIHSALSPRKDINLDLFFRYIDKNTASTAFGITHIKAYVSMDIRLAWRPVSSIELSLVGQNLLAEKHLEHSQELLTTSTEIDRGMYGKLTWSF